MNAEAPWVLVVDDDERIRKLAERILWKHGYGVTTAGNGREALELLATSRPDLVLLDVMMPCVDGFATLKQIRANAATADLPVLMLTARLADPTLPRIMRHLGPELYLSKPFTAGELMQCVREKLGDDSPDT